MNAPSTPNQYAINDGVVRLLDEFIKDRETARAELAKVTGERDDHAGQAQTLARSLVQLTNEVRDYREATAAAVAWRERWQPVIDADAAHHVSHESTPSIRRLLEALEVADPREDMGR